MAEGKADDDRIAQAEFEEYDEILDKLKSSIAYQIKVKSKTKIQKFRNFKKIIQLELIATLKDNDDLTEIAEDYEKHEGKGSI